MTRQIIDQLQPYDFDRLAHKERDGRRRLHLLALAHLKDGKSDVEVADALRVTRHAVMCWMQWFTAGGVARLAGMPHDWSTQRLAKEQQEAFRQAVEQLQGERGGSRVRGKDIRPLLARQFDVACSLNGVYALLKRLGLVWISARAVSPCADPVAQTEFKKTVSKKSQQRCRQALRLSRWTSGSRRKCVLASAARKGKQPRTVRQQQSESAYIFGAVCPQHDSAVGLVMPHANTEAMVHHLQALSEAVAAERHAVLVLDRAGWHTTPKLPQLPNVSLLARPADLPELNPGEQVWQQPRDRPLANRC